MAPEDWVAVSFMFVMDALKKLKYMIVAAIICFGLLYLIWSKTNDAEQACRDKGGVPISSSDGVKCASGVIK